MPEAQIVITPPNIGEILVVLVHGTRRSLRLAEVPLIKEYELNGVLFQSLVEPRLFLEVPVGGRFRWKTQWFMRLSKADTASRISDNMPFAHPNRHESSPMSSTSSVELLIIRNRGRLVCAA